MNELINAIIDISNTIKSTFGFDWIQFGIPTLIALISLGYTFGSNKYEKKIIKQNRFNKLADEYRTDKMYECMDHLWERYKSIKKSANKSANIYCIMLKDEKVNLARRYVSQYLSMFSKYYLENRLDKKEVESFWNKDSLDIIPKIIIPLEEQYARKKFGHDDKKVKNNPILKRLQKFYDKILETYNLTELKDNTPK